MMYAASVLRARSLRRMSLHGETVDYQAQLFDIGLADERCAVSLIVRQELPQQVFTLREKDDRHGDQGRVRSNLVEHINARACAEVDIENDEVGSMFSDTAHRISSRGTRYGPHVQHSEEVTHKGGNLRVILYHNKCCRGFVHHAA